MTREDSITKSVRESLMILIAAALAGAGVGAVLHWALPFLGAAQFSVATSLGSGLLTGVVVARRALLAIRRHEQEELQKRLANVQDGIDQLEKVMPYTPLIAQGVIATPRVPVVKSNLKRVFVLMTGSYVSKPISEIAESDRDLIWATIDLDFEKHKVLMVKKKPKDDDHYLIERTDGSIVYAKRDWAGYWELGNGQSLFDEKHDVIAWAPLSAGIRKGRPFVSSPEEGGPP